MDSQIFNALKGKRVAAVDYGKKRLGVAVCDELHISISPKQVFDPGAAAFWEDFIDFIAKENIAAIVVGVPIRLDEQKTELILEIESFISKLRNLSKLNVFEQDESFSSRRAVETMLTIGKKKKKRAKKGSADLVAAGIILRDFLNELE